MDKSWVSSNRLSTTYDEGVEGFLEFAESNNPNADCIPCPCKNCVNFSHHPIKIVRFHLFSAGFDENYTVWSFHGEKHPELDSRCPNTSVPPDFDYTKGMLHDAFANVDKEPEALKSLLEECEKPLYEGSKYNALSGLLKFQHLKGQFGWSDASFDALLCVLKDILPPDNRIPKSIYEAKKLLKGVGLEYEKIHACENDCLLFWKEDKDASMCRRCGTSRWKKKTKNVRRKVMWYFPPIPRFKRMFSSPEITHDLTSHAQGQVNNGKLTHPRDCPFWKLVDNTWKDFGEEKRNLRLALSADDINPHKSLNSKYSCWPVILITYNLPSYLCMTRKFMMLTLLISWPNQPGNNIDVYLAPLIEDLKLLWETGVQRFDAYKKEYFNLRACLLWTINDFPAYGNLSGCVTKGYRACPICTDDTSSQWLPKSKKVCFIGRRKFLPLDHSLRKRRRDFNNQEENGRIKQPSSGEEIYNYLAGFENTWGKTPKKKKSKDKTPKKKKSEELEGEVHELKKGGYNNASEGASCYNVDFEDEPDEETVDESCFLAVDVPSNLVAKGTMMKQVVLGKNVEVVLETCLQGEALLPIPLADEFIDKVKDAVGHVLSWPTHLIIRCSDLEKLTKKPDHAKKIDGGKEKPENVDREKKIDCEKVIDGDKENREKVDLGKKKETLEGKCEGEGKVKQDKVDVVNDKKKKKEKLEDVESKKDKKNG